MGRFFQSTIDVSLCIFGTVLAILIREGSGFPLANAGTQQALPALLLATAFSAVLSISMLGGSRSFWRYPSYSDLVKLAAIAGLVSIFTTALMFSYNRLTDIPRSLPFLQVLTILILLCLARATARTNMLYRRSRRLAVAPALDGSHSPAATAVLVVGINSVSNAFISATAEFAHGRLNVVGLISTKDRHVGRVFHGMQVLATVNELGRALDELTVRGVTVGRVAICVPFNSLTDEAQSALIEAQRSSKLSLQLVADDLGFGQPAVSAPATPKQSFSFEPATIDGLLRRPYWRFKRAIDVVAASVMLIIGIPFLLLGACAVGVSLGMPVAFWQQRPGRGGRPFKVYKLRTMRERVTHDGYRRSDAERQSLVGNLLRRFRIDELPQIWNILVGDMSFIGPRPLLPVDQSQAHRARLLVRPGMTGWAQVVGGRIVSVDDKAALDVWYIRNASLKLDCEIIARTIVIIIRGERSHPILIDKAWADLADQNIYSDSAVPVISRGRD